MRLHGTPALRLDEPHTTVAPAVGDGLLPGRGSSGGAEVKPELNLTLEGGPAASSHARRALDRLQGRLAPDVFDDVRLLVTELVTNSVRHAGAPAVGLDVALSREAVRVEVSDRGPGFSPRPRQAGQDERSGWGLYLVDRLADRWGVASEEGRSLVWLELNRS